jgi:microcystin-dependent protein
LGSDGYSKKLTYQILKNTLATDAFVLRAGDTMTGALILNTSTPSLSLQAAPKAYVDTFLSKAGGTMTGNLILNTNAPTNALQATSRAYVQNNFLPISGIGTGEQNTGMTGFLTLCAHPISAFHAATKFYVDTLNRPGDGSPVGSIVYFAASAAPVGWFECNGAVLDKTIYVDLFNVIGYSFGGSGNQFLLPDLRGEFLRGWDNGRGVDSGRAFGSAQTDIIKNHTHPFPVDLPLAYGGTFVGTCQRGDTAPGPGVNATSAQTGGGTETRPRNVAFLPCIKYATDAAVNYLGLSAQALLNYVNSLSPKSVAKAWVTFDGTLASPSVVGANYNVSTITKNSTGVYTITFTTPMVDLNYSIVSTAKTTLPLVGTFGTGENTRTVNNVQITTGTFSTLYDSPVVNVVVFGN